MTTVAKGKGFAPAIEAGIEIQGKVSPTPVPERLLGMGREALLGLLLSVPIGLISGLYCGLVVAHYQRFSELRGEALRVVRAIGFIGDDEEGRIRFWGCESIQQLSQIESDLRFLRHRKAADQVRNVHDQIIASKRDAELRKITVLLFGQNYSDWQIWLRQLRPSGRVFLPWGAL